MIRIKSKEEKWSKSIFKNSYITYIKCYATYISNYSTSFYYYLTYVLFNITPVRGEVVRFIIYIVNWKSINYLKLATVYVAHIGRGVAPGCLEIEEIGGLDKRAIENWATDVFGSHYDTKLPLLDMRAILGYDSRRDYFIHARSSFYGDQSHARLSDVLFP